LKSDRKIERPKERRIERPRKLKLRKLSMETRRHPKKRRRQILRTK